MRIESNSFKHLDRIPGEFAFGVPAEGAPMGFGDNRNPHLAWADAPAGTKSFVLLCIDVDVPTVFDDLNQEGKTLPADMPRQDFCHWAMIDIPTAVTEVAAGSCAEGVVSGGKQNPPGPAGSRQGINGYTGFMAGSDMAGDYYGYDGPCPPWNDERLHRYEYRIYALDMEKVDLPDGFHGDDVAAAIEGHVLGSATITGTYSLNPDVA